MICMGDLNDIMYDMEKCNATVSYHRMSALRALIKNSGFFLYRLQRADVYLV